MLYARGGYIHIYLPPHHNIQSISAPPPPRSFLFYLRTKVCSRVAHFPTLEAASDVSISYDNLSRTSHTICWNLPHSLPAESSVKNNLRFKVVEADTPEEKVLASDIPITSTSTSISGTLTGSVKVGVYNAEKDLGCVFSEPCKSMYSIQLMHTT